MSHDKLIKSYNQQLYSNFLSSQGNELCHHKYTKRERVNGKWRYWYDDPAEQEKTKAANSDLKRDKFTGRFTIERKMTADEVNHEIELAKEMFDSYFKMHHKIDDIKSIEYRDYLDEKYGTYSCGVYLRKKDGQLLDVSKAITKAGNSKAIKEDYEAIISAMKKYLAEARQKNVAKKKQSNNSVSKGRDAIAKYTNKVLTHAMDSIEKPNRRDYGHFRVESVTKNSRGEWFLGLMMDGGSASGVADGGRGRVVVNETIYGLKTGGYYPKENRVYAEKAARLLNNAAEAAYQKAYKEWEAAVENRSHKYVRKEQINGKTRYWYEETK